MPKRSSNNGKKHDLNTLAKSIVDQTTGEGEAEDLLLQAEKEGKNIAAVALGRLGGLKGGTARAKKLTPEQRSNIAREAARARWKKNNSSE